MGHIRNGLLRKISLISKFMSQPGRQTIAIQILPNISKCKSNQTMKFGQLIKYNIFFLKIYTQNVVERLLPDPFLKIKIDHISESII